MKILVSSIIAAVAASLITAAAVRGSYLVTVNNLEQDLAEAHETIHNLQHELDPEHDRFTHGEPMDDMAMEDHSEHHEHNHSMAIELSDSDWRPGVSLTVKTDTTGGWNVKVDTTSFTFAPEKVNDEHRAGEGHAHLYVDGEKIARLYAPWFHMASLTPGEHTVSVELNSNNHQPLAVDGVVVSDEVVITQP